MKHKDITGWILTSPYLIFTAVFFIFPLGWSIWLVFSRWSIISPEKKFIGFSNLIEVFKSKEVLAALIYAFKTIGIFIPAVLVISLAIALLINSIPRFKGLFSVGYFLPFMVSTVAISFIAMGLLGWTSPFSVFFRRTIGYTPDWFGNPILAVVVIALMISWKFSGYYALIFLAGLQGIPRELYEAAEIDGTSSWGKLWHITLPMLYPALYTVLILTVGLVFAIFAEPFLLTGGGPNYATHSWQLEIYYQAFRFSRAGYGSAVAVLNAVVVFSAIVAVRKIMERWGKAHGF